MGRSHPYGARHLGRTRERIGNSQVRIGGTEVRTGTAGALSAFEKEWVPSTGVTAGDARGGGADRLWCNRQHLRLWIASFRFES